METNPSSTLVSSPSDTGRLTTCIASSHKVFLLKKYAPT
jgi:hypothetical protein